jgi:hypothetical protein
MNHVIELCTEIKLVYRGPQMDMVVPLTNGVRVAEFGPTCHRDRLERLHSCVGSSPATKTGGRLLGEGLL